jgi:GDP-4-dehydro-6-deoxy-D-mannose reductase
MRVFITGGAGFVGQWLTRAALARGDSVYCADQDALARPTELLTETERRSVRWLPVDIRVGEQLTAAVEKSKPDAVFHLAGISFVPDAQGSPALTYDINTLGVARLLEAIAIARRAGVLDPAILVVGSAEQYGRHPLESMPLAEDAEQRPMTVYAASKAAQEIIALQYYRNAGLRIVATRSFNHSGIGHAKHFLLPALVRRTLAVRAGLRAHLVIGNGTPIRDFLHVTDVVTAYLLLAERGVAGEVYNVCSGVGSSIHELAERVLHRVGAHATVATDATLVRPVDVPVQIGSPAKLVAATGWQPTRSIDDIIDDLIHAATD